MLEKRPTRRISVLMEFGLLSERLRSFLSNRLDVPEDLPDDVFCDTVANQLDRVLDERDELVDRERDWQKSYLRRAHGSENEFYERELDRRERDRAALVIQNRALRDQVRKQNEMLDQRMRILQQMSRAISVGNQADGLAAAASAAAMVAGPVPTPSAAPAAPALSNAPAALMGPREQQAAQQEAPPPPTPPRGSKAVGDARLETALANPTQSALTIAVGNVNYVYNELLALAQAKAKAEGKVLKSEELHQWDVLSGVMEHETLRKLLAMSDLALPDCYELCQLLFVGKQDGKSGGGGKGGGKDGKGGAAAPTPEPPPTDRSKFEKFFLIRHLGLLDLYLGDKGGKDGKGGAAGAENTVGRLDVAGHYLEIVHQVRQAQFKPDHVGFPPQGYPQQGYAQQGYGQYPQPGYQQYPPQHGYQAAVSGVSGGYPPMAGWEQHFKAQSGYDAHYGAR